MIATFRNVEDLAEFCAGLVRARIQFEVTETQCAGVYRVTVVQE